MARFNYQLYGPEQGRKWVFLHGLMGYGSNWRKIVSGMTGPSMAERILTFDQRGHGRSWKPLMGYAADDYAEDVRLITEELGWNKFILVGHSMGGRNALAFAHKYPERLEKLVIEDIGPESNMQAVDYYKNLFAKVPTPFATKLAAKEFFMNEWPRLGVTHDNVLALGQYLYSNLEDKDDDQGHVTIDWRFSKEAILASVLQGRAKDVWYELRGLTMPTLVIRGENSNELSADVFARMQAANANVKGVQIPNAGHWVHADQSHEFLRILLEFANEGA